VSIAKNAPKSARFKLLPAVLLVVGVILGVLTGILALLPSTGTWPVVLGAGAAIAAIVLTFTIAVQQNADTADLNRILVAIEEQTAVRAYDPDTIALPDDAPAAGMNGESVNAPSYADEAVKALRENKAHLNFDNLRWRQKVPSRPTTGNHGWFVESEPGGDSERWFVRKANGLTVRKAMPRNFLDALERQANLDPREIKHDFQLSNHGLAAWYARTYSGALWKVSRSNRNASAGITATLESPQQ
jgi:low affinity Fe/Cu permease